MKIKQIALALAISAAITGCATPSGTPRRVSPHYTAVGSVTDARAYIYSDRTILECADSPFFLSLHDEKGNSIPYEEVGRYYRLDRLYNTFTANINGRSVRFTAVPATQTYVYSTPLSTPTEPHNKPEPVKVQPSNENDLASFIALSKQQLSEIRQALKKSNSRATYDDLNAKLEAIERRVEGMDTIMLQVTFPRYSTTFKPSDIEAFALDEIPKDNTPIAITGFTDSRIAGPMDAKIAQGRAMAARNYLMDIGVNPAMIKIFSQAEGEFIADWREHLNKELRLRFIF
ncbi:conserved exported hypothetical protein [Candidatus Methylobacter favarea]|uniref:OmpA-like domain-containing protein n=1 Tax=Candidatus Methylobacter favarea TaxID=2707345 RepID=A0A8S0Y9W6_9GAMM|nr:OmpA family protein [Candidatus Methylobacter favarea]CAA9890761.1 conserved exported hypothetical protein [Candidatus Methylobacter favarea]